MFQLPSYKYATGSRLAIIFLAVTLCFFFYLLTLSLSVRMMAVKAYALESRTPAVSSFIKREFMLYYLWACSEPGVILQGLNYK